MTGHFAKGLEGGSVIWPDSSLEEFRASYDDLLLRIREDSGIIKLVRCSGYIGFNLVGFWDEIIIESAVFTSEHPFLHECERKVNQMPPSGSPERVRVGNRLLEIAFIDGCRLWVCGPRFFCENY